MTKLDEFYSAKARSPRAATHLLFKWLCDDEDRVNLYRNLLSDHKVLDFQSRADVKENEFEDTPNRYQQAVYLITAKDHVEQAFKSSTREFSNSPFQALGSSTFMLGLDQGEDHDKQRNFALAYLRLKPETILALSAASFMAAAVLPLKRRTFDMVELAEQAALRFVGFLFGFAQADHSMLEPAMRNISRGVDYQVYGRHFVTDPAALPGANVAMATVAKRVAELIDLYQHQVGTQQKDEFRTINDELDEL